MTAIAVSIQNRGEIRFDRRRWATRVAFWVLLGCLWAQPFGGSNLMAQYTPEHPKVRSMVDRGIKYLEASPTGPRYDGEPVLIGYTVFKVTGDVDHPLVKNGIASALRIVESLSRPSAEKIVYDVSMAAVLLATVDGSLYEADLKKVLYFFSEEQKSHGGFGYLDRPTGDTSQVQYVMLALWTMSEVGVDVPARIVEDTMNYLLLTMDPSGAWGYQGVVAQNRLVAQEKVSKSLATAGAGSLIIGGDILRFFGVRKKENEEDEGVPKAFVRVDLLEQERKKRADVTMRLADIERPLTAVFNYHNRVPTHNGNWYYYWRYSQERFESFREIMNKRQEKSPAWYNAGVEELARYQDEDGGWGTRKPDVTTDKVSTCFSVLFLIRSTQKAIGKLDEGFTFGGYQLPSDLTTVRMMGDRLVSAEETSVENLLEMLEKDEAKGVQVGLVPEHLQLSSDPAQRREQVARLSRLLVSGDYRARQIAARLLGRTDDLSVVPDLIYALTDPNDKVPMIAEESLRLLSRKLDAVHVKQNPSVQDRSRAEAFWKEWYLGLRPEHIFIDR